MNESNKVPPLFVNSVAQVTIKSEIDKRKSNLKGGVKRIIIMVSYRGKRYYYNTGEKITPEDYLKLVKARTSTTSPLAIVKGRIEKMHFRIFGIVGELIEKGTFSLKAVDEVLESGYTDRTATFIDHYMRIASEKTSLKTRTAYRTALVSYLKSLGAYNNKVYNDKGKQEKKYDLDVPDRVMNLMPRDITALSIAEWQKKLKNEGRTDATISMYVRPMKCVLRTLYNEGVLKAIPEIKISTGTRRTENFLSVEQILRLMEYKGDYEYARDMWLMLYFCNGCNAKDFISLKWGEDYFQNNELSFIRSKTQDKSPSLVLIPIIEPLKALLDRHASKPSRGKELFPNLLNGAKTEEELTIRADYLNCRIREGMEKVCSKMELPKASAAWARNSYITALTWHGISDAFIDNMTGHVGSNSVLRGYQGRISPAKRYKINSLLVVPPED